MRFRKVVNLIVLNFILLALYFLSFFLRATIPTDGVDISALLLFIPILMAALLSPLAAVIVKLTHGCENSYPIGLGVSSSLLFWGIVGIFTSILTIAMGCSDVSFSLGHFIFSSATLTGAFSAIVTSLACRKSPQ